MCDYGIYEIYLNATMMGSPEVERTATMREDTLKLDQIDSPESESPFPSGLVALVVVAGLLLGSVGSFAFGTLKVAEGATSFRQEITSGQLGGWGDL